MGSVDEWRAHGAWPENEDPDRGYLCYYGFCPVCHGEGCPRYAEGFDRARAETLARSDREIDEVNVRTEPPQPPAAVTEAIRLPGCISAWLRRWVKWWPGVMG